MSWKPWEPVGSKKKDSVFEPVDLSNKSTNDSNNSWGFNSGGSSQNSWAYQTTPNNQNQNQSSWAFQGSQSNQNQNSWAFSNSQNNTSNGNSSSWAYSTGTDKKGHWGYQQGYGFGDQSGFGNDTNLWSLESQKRQSVWGNCDGSSWHFSNASKDLDVYHSIDSARRVSDANSLFGTTWGFSSTPSKSSEITSTFNPFSSNFGFDNKKKC